MNYIKATDKIIEHIISHPTLRELIATNKCKQIMYNTVTENVFCLKKRKNIEMENYFEVTLSNPQLNLIKRAYENIYTIT